VRSISNISEFVLITGADLSFDEVVDDLDVIAQSMVALLKAFSNSTMSWTGFSVEELDGSVSTGPVGFASPVPGTDAGDSEPTSLAALVSFPTGQKRRILKKFCGPLSKNMIGTTGSLSSLAQTLGGNFADYMMATQEETNGAWKYGHEYTDLTGKHVIFPSSFFVRLIPSPLARRKRE